MTHQFDNQLLMARALIRTAPDSDWSFQGLGMFRLYLAPHVRLHVWVPELAFPNVSTIHTHPWHFTSTVLQGQIIDRLYEFKPQPDGPWRRQMIKCGPGGGPIPDTAEPVQLTNVLQTITVRASFRYSLTAKAIHESIPDAGTITIINREPTEDTEHAFVFYEAPGGWVSAEPRPATAAELARMRQAALEIPLPEHLR